MKKQIKSAKTKTSVDSALLKEIRGLIMAARKAVVRNVDTIQVMTNFEIGRRINRLVNKLTQSAENVTLLESTESDIRVLLATISGLDLHASQNVFFAIAGKTYGDMNEKADSGDKMAKEWVKVFAKLASRLNIKIQ